MEDVKNQVEAQTVEAAQVKKAQTTKSGIMRGAILALTGEGVADEEEKTEKEIRKLVMEEPAPSDS